MVHKNPNLYNRREILEEIMPQDRRDDHKLREAFEDILKTNEISKENNYMLDVFKGIRETHFPVGQIE